MKSNSKTKRKDAEKAAEWYCHEHHRCVITCRSMVTQWQRQDLFACDCIGKRADGTGIFVQVTAGQSSAVSSRRKKLEVIPWHPSDTVELLQLVQTPDPANGQRTLYFFRIHKFLTHDSFVYGKRYWKTLETAVPVPAAWFKAYKVTGGK